jgi:uncharacterized protein (TIGR02466 family)|tara:strand:- start:4511 stop:5125 length:615 start_codon:yes stop_codon:yes gene_type:complete
MRNINFGPYVAITPVNKIIIERLLKDGIETKESYNHKLAGHLESQFKYNNETTNWFYKSIQPILQQYRHNHSIFHSISNENVELTAIDLWVNFMKAGDFNPVHYHGGDYSFVLFLEIPEELKKEQQEHRGTSMKPGELHLQYTQASKPRWATEGVSVNPKVGDMIIFPANLMHMVCPFKSTGTRISVSGNLFISNRDKLPYEYF